MSARETSFSTIASTRFFVSLARAFSSRFSVSAAKPISIGERLPVAWRKLPRSARMSGLGSSCSSSAAVALDLLRRNILDVIVGDRGSHDDEAGLLPAIEHRGAHLLRGLDEDGLGRGRRLQRGRPAHQDDLRSATQRSFGERVSHLAAGAIAEIAHRIDGLVGRSGGDEHGLAREVLRDAEALQRGRDDLFRFGQTSRADHAAGQISAARLDDGHAATAQDFQIRLRRRMLPHVDVHGGRDDHRARWWRDRAC